MPVFTAPEILEVVGGRLAPGVAESGVLLGAGGKLALGSAELAGPLGTGRAFLTRVLGMFWSEAGGIACTKGAEMSSVFS